MYNNLSQIIKKKSFMISFLFRFKLNRDYSSQNGPYLGFKMFLV